MPFFTKPSLLFISTNMLRLVSVVAICLTLAGISVSMSHDFKRHRQAQHDQQKSNVPTTTASINVVKRHYFETSTNLIPEPTSSIVTVNMKHFYINKDDQMVKRHFKKIVRRDPAPPPLSIDDDDVSVTTTTVRPRKTTAMSSMPYTSTTRIMTATNSSPTSTPVCAYNKSDSTRQSEQVGSVGGILFSALNKIFCIILLLFLLISELSPPIRFTQMFWNYAFPPLGSNFGVGTLGVIQVFVGCNSLSHVFNNQFERVSFWFLFIIGFLNILAGLTFGSKIKPIRSIFDLESNSNGSIGLAKVFNRQQDHQVAPSSAYQEFDRDTTKPSVKMGRQMKPIVISPPMTTLAPPVYQGSAK
ncbi:hypothetical protein OIO90_003525 [Microbotryomycetes sp. JL221]|nr:hypothetical protein OIO90_003525 [Microbotryomycetes sp. JL221]